MKKWINIIVILALPVLLLADNKPEYAVSNISLKLLEGANTVIRSATTKFDVDSPSKATKYQSMVVTRLNEDASFEYVVAHYDLYTKVKNITASLYDANGKLIRKFKKNDIIDRSAVSSVSIYQDDRLKYIDLSYGIYPYTVEYTFEVEYNGIRSYPAWYIQPNVQLSVETSNYILHLPNDISVNTKMYQVDPDIQVGVEDGKQIFNYNITNLPAKKIDANTPYKEEQLAAVFFAPSVFEVDGYSGDMSSWKTFGQFIFELNKGRDKLSPSMVQKVQELTNGLETAEEKIAVLYRYMQDNMRYVSVQLGIGGWQSYDALYVEENKYGDCKALSNFMKAMLKEVGITSYTTLVYAGKSLRYKATKEFSYPFFNHAILYIPEGDYWLECTSSSNPPNYLGSFTADRNVLLITPEGGKLSRTPKITTTESKQVSQTTMKILETGEANLSNNIIYSGVLQDDWRYLFTTENKKEQERLYFRYSDLSLKEIKAFKLDVHSKKPEATITYEVLTSCASRAGKRLFIPFNIVNTFNYIPSGDERTSPYFHRTGFTDEDTINIILPTNAKIESLPKPIEIISDFGTYRVAFEQEGTNIKCTRFLEIDRQLIAPSEYEQWSLFCQRVTKADKAKIVVLLERA